MRILIVDDEAECQERIAAILCTRFPEAEVVKAGDYLEMWGQLRAGGAFDFITMDGQFGPNRGDELTAELRSKGVQCPIVVITAAHFMIERARRQGANGGCGKFNLEQDLPAELDRLSLTA